MNGLWGRVTSVPVAIDAAQTESETVDLRPIGQLSALVIPEAFTGTAIAFKAAIEDDGPFLPVYNEGADYSVPVQAGRYVVIDPAVFHGVVLVRLVSNAAEAEAREIQVIGRDFA